MAFILLWSNALDTHTHTHRHKTKHKLKGLVPIGQREQRRCGHSVCLSVTDHLAETMFYESRLLGTDLSTVVSFSHFRLENLKNKYTFLLARAHKHRYTQTSKHKQVWSTFLSSCKLVFFSKSLSKVTLITKFVLVRSCVCVWCSYKHTFTDLLSDLGLHLLHLE